jgi:small-conductance mechanosensitive channel
LTACFFFYRVLVSSAVLATAFVFGTTAATMFRALLMIFYTNPFGVGDWIRVDGEILQVRELGLSFFRGGQLLGRSYFPPGVNRAGRADL